MDKKPARKPSTRYGEFRDLTDRQKLFVQEYTNSTNPKTFLRKRASAIAAGIKATGSAAVTACAMTKKPHVKAAIIEALRKVKISPEYQAKRLKRLMEWTRPYYHDGLKIADIEDGEIQHKALVTSLKITEALDNLEKSLDEKGQGLSVHIAPELAERLVRIASEMKMMREAHSTEKMPLIELKSKGEA